MRAEVGRHLALGVRQRRAQALRPARLGRPARLLAARDRTAEPPAYRIERGVREAEREPAVLAAVEQHVHVEPHDEVLRADDGRELRVRLGAHEGALDRLDRPPRLREGAQHLRPEPLEDPLLDRREVARRELRRASEAPAEERLEEAARERRVNDQHPLTAQPGQLVRFWVVDAGPSLDTDFHIVGTILNTAYAFGDMKPADALHNVQTVTVPAGGGGVFDVKIDQPGLYPFVSHAFAAVDQGQVGLLNVGNVQGTMSH